MQWIHSTEVSLIPLLNVHIQLLKLMKALQKLKLRLTLQFLGKTLALQHLDRLYFQQLGCPGTEVIVSLSLEG